MGALFDIKVHCVGSSNVWFFGGCPMARLSRCSRVTFTARHPGIMILHPETNLFEQCFKHVQIKQVFLGSNVKHGLQTFCGRFVEGSSPCTGKPQAWGLRDIGRRSSDSWTSSPCQTSQSLKAPCIERSGRHGLRRRARQEARIKIAESN